MTTQQTITSTVKYLMGTRGEYQRDLAAALELAVSAISARMLGRIRWSVDDLDKLSAHYGLPVAAFVEPMRLASPWGQVVADQLPGYQAVPSQAAVTRR